MLNSNSICVGVRSSGFPKAQSYQVINLIQTWLRECGPEWTVDRLKALKAWYVQRLSGVDPDRPDWVAFNTRGLPSGPLSLIFRCRKPQKVISALMAYTGVTLKSVSRSQWDKFYKSLSKPPNKLFDYVTEGWAVRWREICPSSEVYELGCFDIPQSRKTSRFDHVKISDLAGRQIRIPSYDLDCRASVDMSAEEIIKGVNHPLARRYLMYNMTNVPTHISNLLVACDQNSVGDGSKSHVGRIGFIQEPGCKLRAVANPLPIFQLLLSRLGQELYSRLHQMENDCTFDQEKGLNLVSDQLDRGNRIHSLDLSDATNNFPFGLTFAFLARRITYAGSDMDWALFASLARATWKAPPNPDNQEEVRWTVGQPLGLYPSFAAFALSHHYIVKDLIWKHGLEGDDAFYVILGDDIVCSDKLGPILRDAYSALSIPISEAKSVSSAVLAEFAGRLVLKRDSPSKTQILVQPKYRSISDRSFIQLRKNLGRQVTQFFRPRQLRVLSFLEQILSDHHPCGLKSWRNLRNSGEYVLSQLLAEAITSDRLVERRSPLSEDLRDVKDMILIESARQSLGYNQEQPSNQIKSGNREEQLLEKFGVTKADFPEDAPSSWLMSQDIGGDPRGPSSLEVMENKIRSAKSSKIHEIVERFRQRSKRSLHESTEDANGSVTELNRSKNEPLSPNHCSDQGYLDSDDQRDTDEMDFFRRRT